MGRILHLSDLHFGRDRRELVAPLLAQAHALRPDVTVVSGDLTQRARGHQYREAAALIAALPQPVLSTPGNHDVPLYNPLARMLCPFHRYRRHVPGPMEPVIDTPDLLVIALNTTDPYAWQRGVMRPASLVMARRRLAAARPGQLRVVTFHHPLHTPPQTGKTPMKDAGRGAQALAEAGADVVLTGHLHLWAAAPYAIHKGGRAMLCVQSGTTLSTRVRGEDNDFNVIDHEDGLVTVTRYCTDGDRPVFQPDAVTRFHKDASTPMPGWQLHADDLPPPEA